MVFRRVGQDKYVVLVAVVEVFARRKVCMSTFLDIPGAWIPTIQLLHLVIVGIQV